MFYFLFVLSVHHRLGVGILLHAVTQGPQLKEALSLIPLPAGITQSLLIALQESGMKEGSPTALLCFSLKAACITSAR